MSGGAVCMGPLLEEAAQPEASSSVASGQDAAKKSDETAFLCHTSSDYGH